MARGDQEAVNAQGLAIKGFLDRTGQYVALHKKVAGTVPPLRETDDAAKVAAREQALGDAIAAARTGAALGDVFGADFGPIAKRAVRMDWAERAPADRRALLADLPAKMSFRVNMRYPPALPLLTMPPRLLAELPRLPEELEYRFLGRHLILRDTKANIVVDAIVDALPPLSRT